MISYSWLGMCLVALPVQDSSVSFQPFDFDTCFAQTSTAREVDDAKIVPNLWPVRCASGCFVAYAHTRKSVKGEASATDSIADQPLYWSVSKMSTVALFSGGEGKSDRGASVHGRQSG